ncbi:MAG TPA: TMEM175 family protein [Candidatus Acidoferrum sp.]|nr:TMEM175 family protein [Candidatus Acidoferrum sp.]
MKKGRLEAFSDGVFAVIITFMVFNIKVPQSSGFHGLLSVLPVFLSYILSFLYVGIYWNNHHHLLQASESVSGRILWANLHLLFWLSLAPFATAWMGQNHIAPAPVAFYGLILLCAGIAYFILTKSLVAHHRQESALAIAVGKDRKGLLSIAVYVIAIPLAFVRTWAAYVCYALVVVMWLLPDPRIEKVVRD